jgi:hypothetical protein
MDIGTDTDTNATYIVDDVPRVVAPEVEDAFPKAPMRMDAHERLAKSNKNRNVEERIWGQLMQLDPIDEQQATKKFVNRNGKAANEEVDKSYPESNGRTRRALISGHLQGLFLQHTHLLQQLLVLGGDLRPLPS